MDPSTYPRWADVLPGSAEPAGELRSNMRLTMATGAFGLRFPVVFDVGQLVPSRRFPVRVQLPFGVVNEETITISPLPDGGCRVAFN